MLRAHTSHWLVARHPSGRAESGRSPHEARMSAPCKGRFVCGVLRLGGSRWPARSLGWSRCSPSTMTSDSQFQAAPAPPSFLPVAQHGARRGVIEVLSAFREALARLHGPVVPGPFAVEPNPVDTTHSGRTRASCRIEHIARASNFAGKASFSRRVVTARPGTHLQRYHIECLRGPARKPVRGFLILNRDNCSDAPCPAGAPKKPPKASPVIAPNATVACPFLPVGSCDVQ